MTLLNEGPTYSYLENRLLDGLNNPRRLTEAERSLRPDEFNTPNGKFQDVHEIPLESPLDVWNNGAWCILKPRFYNSIISFDEAALNNLIASILKQESRTPTKKKEIGQLLITSFQTDVVFDAFIMMKIMIEKFKRASPSKEETLIAYQSSINYTELTPHEKILVESFWPGTKNPLLWEESRSKRIQDTLELVFGNLQEIIAKIAINSYLQHIALAVGLQERGLPLSLLNNSVGVCDLAQTDLETMTELLRMLPETQMIHDWLIQYESPIARILSKQLDAVLKKPPNVEQFLESINLKRGSAKEVLDNLQARLEVKSEAPVIESKSELPPPERKELSPAQKVNLFKPIIEFIQKELSNNHGFFKQNRGHREVLQGMMQAIISFRDTLSIEMTDAKSQAFFGMLAASLGALNTMKPDKHQINWLSQLSKLSQELSQVLSTIEIAEVEALARETTSSNGPKH